MTARCGRWWVVLMALAVVAPGVGAAQVSPTTSSSCTAGAKGTVSGLLANGDLRPLPGAQVSLGGFECKTSSDSAGRFSLGGVPDGRNILWVTLGGYQTLDTAFVIDGGKAVTLSLVLSQPDPIRALCPMWPYCPALPGNFSLYTAAYVTLLSFAGTQPGTQDFGSLSQCASITSYASGGVSLQDLPSGIYPSDECTVSSDGGWIIAPGGGHAVDLHFQVLQLAQNRAVITMSYRIAQPYAATWTCAFETGLDGWRVASCDPSVVGS